MMKRMRLYISLIIIMTSFAAAYCGNPRSIRHHCSNDTTEISELLRRGFESGITNPNKLIVSTPDGYWTSPMWHTRLKATRRC